MLLCVFNIIILCSSFFHPGPFPFILSSVFFLTLLYALSMTVFSTTLGLTIETGISIFYLLLTSVLCIPRIPFADSLNTVFRLLRLSFIPGSTVTFPEVLIADALTSMSKVLKDFGVTLISVYCYVNGTSIVDYHNQSMILIALLASLPYW